MRVSDLNESKKHKVVSLGQIGVDSGTLMISDPSYNASDSDESFTKKEMIDSVIEMAGDHSKSLNFKEGHTGRGVIFPSSGDGTFDVSGVVDESDKLIAIHIKLR